MTTEDRALIVGGGLAGLVAAFELMKKNIPVTILDQENEANLGGQAFWSLGGIYCVNSAMQRSCGIKDNRKLAFADWLNTAKFDRPREDYWPKQWAEAFVNFAETEMEPYLKQRGVSFLTCGWAERGSGSSDGHGNSVPRFHLTWGTGPAIVKAFADPVKEGVKKGLIELKFRYRVTGLILDEHTGAAVGVKGEVLEPTDTERGVASSRKVVDHFEIRSKAVLLSTGGIGGNIEAVKQNWPVERLGPIPRKFVVGVPAHVDGLMVPIAKDAGASVVNMDRMWHYTEGLSNWNSIWPKHGIRVIPGPSSLWLNAEGVRFPGHLSPGCDTLSALRHICQDGHDYSWFILNRSIISREFTLSGSEQNPDITGKSYLLLLQRFFGRYGTTAVQNFVKHGEDFVSANNLEDLVNGMNVLAEKRNGPPLTLEAIKKVIDSRDSQTENPYSKDGQLMMINNARQYPSDKRRIAPLRKLLEPSDGPLIAVQLNILTRKSLGGLETNLDSNVMRDQHTPFIGLYAAGESAGFGGGGVHGYSSLEGTFLGGCIFSGMKAGKAMAEQIRRSGIPARL